MGEYVFDHCEELKSVTIEEGLAKIEKGTFRDCFALSKVTIPLSIKSIGISAFPSWTGINASSKDVYYAGKESEWAEIEIADGNPYFAKATIHCSDSAQDLSDAVVSGLKSMTYTGKPITQAPIVKLDSKALTSGTDYTVSYSNNTNTGTATVTITGKGKYKGTKTATFKILPGKTTRGDMFNLANNVKVTWKAVPGAKYYKVYRSGVKDPVIVTSALVGYDKTAGLENGKKYTYRIVASLTGKGDSSGDSPLSYSKVMYRLKTVAIRSVKNTAPGKVTVTYDKTTAGDSYVLQYSEKQDMTGAKTKVVMGANTTSYVIGGLKKGKTYYISIRVRKKVNGIDYYTTFGVPKKVTITK